MLGLSIVLVVAEENDLEESEVCVLRASAPLALQFHNLLKTPSKRRPGSV